ncbi:MAG: PVC-type heme-binding CxxCH protein [Ginsengibacter sp.]
MNIINNHTGKLLFIVGTLLWFSCSQKKHYKEALSPIDEMKHFELDSSFKVEIFASEPNVLSPVDMAWDEEGNIYVIEMGDYPDNGKEVKGKGRIRILKDNNHDGIIDTAIVFANNLPSATSMLAWKGGLIITAAPDILYLKDTTGDLHADTREVLFTGFFAKNSEAQITCLRFGVDNWIYANNNAQDGKISFAKNPAAPKLNVGGSDFRFRLDKGLFENETGWGQFGMTMDDYGHRFYTQNTLHIQQSPIPWRYLHRHNFLPPFNADINISDHDPLMFQKTPPPYWRYERTLRRQKTFDEDKLDRKEYADKHFTGSSGGTFYLSDVFPKEYYGSVFTGDVAGNLVHRDLLIPRKDNPAFVAKRSEKEKDREFLASTDPWTRPANFTVGPDGYLYLIDIYRQHIEAPSSVPEDLKAEMNYSNGENYGRIYRILPKNVTKEKTITQDLNSKTSAELVSMIADPNQWLRQRAHILLIQRQDKSVVPLLKTMFETHSDPRARIHSLYVLDGLDELNINLVLKALKDPEPGVREHAVILSQKYPQLLPQLLELINDTSAQVILQATLSLGEFTDTRVVQAFAKVIEQHAEDSLLRVAVLSSNEGSGPELLKVLIDRNIFLKDATSPKIRFLKDLCYVIGARNDEKEILKLTELLSHPEIKNKTSLQLPCLDGLGNGLENAENKNKNKQAILTALEKNLPEQNEEFRASIKKIKQAIGATP